MLHNCQITALAPLFFLSVQWNTISGAKMQKYFILFDFLGRANEQEKETRYINFWHNKKPRNPIRGMDFN